MYLFRIFSPYPSRQRKTLVATFRARLMTHSKFRWGGWCGNASFDVLHTELVAVNSWSYLTHTALRPRSVTDSKMTCVYKQVLTYQLIRFIFKNYSSRRKIVTYMVTVNERSTELKKKAIFVVPDSYLKPVKLQQKSQHKGTVSQNFRPLYIFCIKFHQSPLWIG